MPEYHTDLSFSRALFEIRREIFIKAVSVEWNRDLTISRMPRELSIPWSLVEKEAHDRGSYVAIFRLEKNHTFQVGKLGHRTFKRGYYLYAGSAMKDLTRRMNRHRRRRKRFFWHIDYLREKAAFVTALPVRTEARLECEIAGNLGKISDWSIEGFGASDCSCGTHLFGMRENPIVSPLFVNMLLYFRIDRLNDQVQT